MILALLLAVAAHAAPQKVEVPKTVIPVYPARAAGTASLVRPGSLPQVAVPAPAAKAPAAVSQLSWGVDIGENAKLLGHENGDVSFEVSAGDRLFDMRRDQLGRQWPAVAAAVREAAAKPTLTDEELLAGVHARAAELRRTMTAPGGVRLDAQMQGPLVALGHLASRTFYDTEFPTSFRQRLQDVLAGFDRAVRKAAALPDAADKPVINDVTQLNPVTADRVIAPTTIEELSRAVASHTGAVSVGGGRYSMGGQTASEDALQIDLRRYNKVLAFDPQAKEITVQPGIRWRDLQRFIDPHDLSVKIMQSYADFTVGGALSVNAHGRYMGLGPVILSVKRIKVVLADGTVKAASPTQNAELFYGALGGYGGLGVIAEATLSLADNKPLEQRIVSMPASEYKEFFFKTVRNDAAAVFHNADLRPPYDHATSVTFYETDRPVTVKKRMNEAGGNYWLSRWMIYLITERPWGQVYRRAIDWVRERLPNPVVWRNYEASYDVLSLEPSSRARSTYVLQEYFVPVEKFDEFRGKMAEILNRYKVNALNVSIRHAKADPGSKLAWAREESFAFVLYHKQGTSEADKGRVAVWTRELIDAVIAEGGAYYLPYQLHARPDQFHAAYPKAKEYFELKKKLDPSGKFTNKLLDAYFFAPEREPARDPKSNFKTVYMSTRWRDRFYKYLQNIFHLYPEEKLHQVLWEETAKGPSDDKAIYQAAEPRVKAIKPFLADLRYALPALAVQKDEIADETVELLGERGKQPINGYLEWGAPGRYVKSLQKRLDMKGPVYVASFTPMDNSLSAIFERGGLRGVGTYIPNVGDPITPEQVPDASVDLITVYPGLHHHPLKKLDPFVASLWRILRPGGRLVIRDHDVDSREMDHFAGLVHDVYNLGVGDHWDNNEKEVRHFTSNDGLAKAMLGRGFRDTGKRIHQKNDPTQNVLMEFEKIDKPGEPMAVQAETRRAEMTYLTMPEWYIVYASREYAQALKSGPPSRFRYFGAITQYWDEYRAALKNAKVQNRDAQMMLIPIGVSHTLEFAIKGVWENTVGRVTEWLSGGGRTAEDAYARKVAQDYIGFIDVTPWYRFPYGSALKGLWSQPLLGRHMIRKLERRAFLSAEYTAKLGLAKLFTFLAERVFEPEAQTTTVVAKDLHELLQLDVVYRYDDGRVAARAPRYQLFTDFVRTAAKFGTSFESIAGNSTIAMTYLVPTGYTVQDPAAKSLGRYGLLNSNETERLRLEVPVKDLTRVVASLDGVPGVTLEHVYDF